MLGAHRATAHCYSGGGCRWVQSARRGGRGGHPLTVEGALGHRHRAKDKRAPGSDSSGYRLDIGGVHYAINSAANLSNNGTYIIISQAAHCFMTGNSSSTRIKIPICEQ